MPFQIIIRIKVPSSMLNLPEQKRLELIDSWVEDQESLTIESAKLVRIEDELYSAA